MKRARGMLRAMGPSAIAAVVGIATAVGVLDSDPPSFVAMMLLAAIVVASAIVISRRIRRIGFERVFESSWWKIALVDVEVALTFVVGCAAVIAVTGGLHSPLYPLLYAVIAFSATFQSAVGTLMAVGAALTLEITLVGRSSFVSAAVTQAGFHAVFIGGAAIAHSLFLRRLVASCRNQYASDFRQELRAQRNAARDYRLIATSLGPDSRAPRTRAEEEHILVVGGLQAISEAIYHHLKLLQQTIRAKACVLLWLDDSSGRLKLKEVVSEELFVVEHTHIDASGVLGAIVRERTPMTLDSVRADQLAYAGPSRSEEAFCGVPVLEGNHLRGILCADRQQPFGVKEVALLETAGEQVIRIIRSERVFLSVEKAKYEYERFYHASAMLCEALTLEQVMETAFNAAAEITQCDVAVISLYERDRKKHRVCSVRVAPGAEDIVTKEQLSGLEFRDNAGLAAMVVKNRHYLPAGGELRDVTVPVYTKRIRFKGAESLLVLPLLSADEAIGTFLLASKRRHRFGKDVREMLRIIANQVAVSLQNALMYRKMETMATTDGLTGLTNHRTFQHRFSNMLARAGRHGHRAAVLLCDVDHFKRVNDTFGHQVGDEVLRRVAEVLQQVVRKIDITARYGGEEFVVVLESTSQAGALRLAERIRKDVGALEFDSGKGKFGATLSIGVAVFPEDAMEESLLIECADLALYHAKDTGRNRVISYQDFAATRRTKKAS